MTDHEPTPIERTQLIEIALNTFESDSQIGLNQLEHNIGKIDSEMGEDADVKPLLDGLRNSIAELKRARRTKSQEEEKATLVSASAANLRLRGVIAEKMRR